MPDEDLRRGKRRTGGHAEQLKGYSVAVVIAVAVVAAALTHFQGYPRTQQMMFSTRKRRCASAAANLSANGRAHGGGNLPRDHAGQEK